MGTRTNRFVWLFYKGLVAQDYSGSGIVMLWQCTSLKLETTDEKHLLPTDGLKRELISSRGRTPHSLLAVVGRKVSKSSRAIATVFPLKHETLRHRSLPAPNCPRNPHHNPAQCVVTR